LEKNRKATGDAGEEEEKRKKMQEASRTMNRLAKKLGRCDLQATIANFVTLT
jgi:hypothetical protein